MKIAKPLLLVTTPIGVAYGLYEGWRLAGGLVFIMAAMIGVIAVAIGEAGRSQIAGRRGPSAPGRGGVAYRGSMTRLCTAVPK